MIRKARIQDVQQIHSLINNFAKQDLMLARSLNDIYDGIRDFWVYVENNKVLGCCALHTCWDDLAEIKSLAVEKNMQKKNIGTQLVTACIEETRDLGVKKVFVLTYKPDFFRKFGFRRIRHNDLPHKVWAECINCPKFPGCQEIALLKVL